MTTADYDNGAELARLLAANITAADTERPASPWRADAPRAERLAAEAVSIAWATARKAVEVARHLESGHLAWAEVKAQEVVALVRRARARSRLAKEAALGKAVEKPGARCPPPPIVPALPRRLRLVRREGDR